MASPNARKGSPLRSSDEEGSQIPNEKDGSVNETSPESLSALESDGQYKGDVSQLTKGPQGRTCVHMTHWSKMK